METAGNWISKLYYNQSDYIKYAIGIIPKIPLMEPF